MLSPCEGVDMNKRLRSVVCVEEKPARKKQRARRKRRPGPQSAAKSLPEATRGHDTEASTRLFISNIADEVPCLCDIIELLFKQIGRLRRHKIHCDPEGHFQGTAEVVYERWDDAIAAVRRYDNNINIFGRTWKVELVGENQVSLIEASRPVAAESGACKQTMQSRLHECSSRRRDGNRALPRDSRKQKRDVHLEEYYRERQPVRGTKRLTMREALDADLDRYHKIAQSSEI